MVTLGMLDAYLIAYAGGPGLPGVPKNKSLPWRAYDGTVNVRNTYLQVGTFTRRNRKEEQVWARIKRGGCMVNGELCPQRMKIDFVVLRDKPRTTRNSVRYHILPEEILDIKFTAPLNLLLRDGTLGALVATIRYFFRKRAQDTFHFTQTDLDFLVLARRISTAGWVP